MPYSQNKLRLYSKINVHQPELEFNREMLLSERFHDNSVTIIRFFALIIKYEFWLTMIMTHTFGKQKCG